MSANLPSGGGPASDEGGRPFASVWGDAMIPGFQQVPHALIKNQFRLGLSPLDMVIVLNIAAHWWETANRPYPTIGRLAKRIGVSRRSIERRIALMEKSGILKRMPYEISEKGKKIRRFDLTSLVDLVQERAQLDPMYEIRKRYKELAVAGSRPATGLRPDIVQTAERQAASKPAGRARPVSPR